MATFFVYKPLWFVLAQTDGEPLPEPQTTSWDSVAALASLDMTEIPFDAMNGNVMGFARERSIALNPVNGNAMPGATATSMMHRCGVMPSADSASCPSSDSDVR